MKEETTTAKKCAITGAGGYLGGVLVSYFQNNGWTAAEMTRRPSSPGAIPFHLGEEISPKALEYVDALVHCAYDFAPRKWQDIHRVNVEGSRKLFAAAREAGVRTLLFISTMSAFEGCKSLYGKAKLEIENAVHDYGGIILRPGLIHGDPPGGMFGRLVGQVKKSSLTPVFGGGTQVLYLAHAEDLAKLILRICAGHLSAPNALTAAHEQPWTFCEILEEIARSQGRSLRFMSLPWRPVWLGLHCAEMAGLRLNFRSDSLVSLLNQNPNPQFEIPRLLGFRFRPFAMTNQAGMGRNCRASVSDAGGNR